MSLPSGRGLLRGVARSHDRAFAEESPVQKVCARWFLDEFLMVV
jgi:hypothetical protein